MSKTNQIKVDLELLKKYNRPGPRYTSYPTVPHFTSQFGPGEFQREIEESNQRPNLAPLSLYFHFPFCKTLCHYCGCNVIITHSQAKIDNYLDLLKKEIDMVAARISPSRPVVQLHWGGGSPCYMPVESIRDIYSYIAGKFTIDPAAEISVEVDPRRLTPQHLPTLRELGFNRISFGVQDVNPQVQEAVNRVQPFALTQDVVQTSRDLGFDSVNIDLIYGLPHQTLESYQETLEKALELAPHRLAVFSYAHVPWLKKHQNAMDVDAMPKPIEKLQILKTVIERLTGEGYRYIGMDHFAREGDELTQALDNGTLHRNFQGYTTHAGAEIYAMGISSISQLHNVYAQNTKDMTQYRTQLEKGELTTVQGIRLTDEDHLRRYVIQEILCNLVVDKREVETRFEVDFERYFAPALELLSEPISDGLVQWNADRVQVSEPGRLVIRNIAMAFDSYLSTESGQKPLYSRTV